MRFGKFSHIVLVMWVAYLLTGCMGSSEDQQSRAVADQFWQAVLQEDMETAKNLSTWESSQYLQFLHSKLLSAKRFETGELKIENGMAEIATVLYGGDRGDMKVPLRTVLVQHEQKWLVDVQKTMGSMVSGAMGAVVEQLNSFMQDGLKGLDETLNESIDQLGKDLQDSMDELRKDLTVPPAAPKPPGQKQI